MTIDGPSLKWSEILLYKEPTHPEEMHMSEVDYELSVRNGKRDVPIALRFVRAPFSGVRRIRTVDRLKRPELRDPQRKVVASGHREIRGFIKIVHESQSY